MRCRILRYELVVEIDSVGSDTHRLGNQIVLKRVAGFGVGQNVQALNIRREIAAERPDKNAVSMRLLYIRSIGKRRDVAGRILKIKPRGTYDIDALRIRKRYSQIVRAEFRPHLVPHQMHASRRQLNSRVILRARLKHPFARSCHIGRSHIADLPVRCGNRNEAVLILSCRDYPVSLLKFRHDILLKRSTDPDGRVLCRGHGGKCDAVSEEHHSLRLGENHRADIGICGKHFCRNVQSCIERAEHRHLIGDISAVHRMLGAVRFIHQHIRRCRDDHLLFCFIIVKAGIQALRYAVGNVHLAVALNGPVLIDNAVNHGQIKRIGQLVIGVQIRLLGRYLRPFVLLVTVRASVYCTCCQQNECQQACGKPGRSSHVSPPAFRKLQMALYHISARKKRKNGEISRPGSLCVRTGVPD